MKTRRIDGRLRQRILGELLEPRHPLSAVGFVAHELDAKGPVSSVFAADLDGDDDVDLLSTSSQRDSATGTIDTNIGWYENTDGQGTFAEKQVIASKVDGSVVIAEDLDEDGDLELLSSPGWAFFGPPAKVTWFENIGDGESFEEQQIVTTLSGLEGEGAYFSIQAADADGDGDVDVFVSFVPDFSHSGMTAWYENTNGQGTFGEARVISEAEGIVRPADVDGDGDMDLLLHDWRILGLIAWHENTDGVGNFGEQRVIAEEVECCPIGEPPSSFYALDLDGDSDVDVLSGERSNIGWDENTDGRGTFAGQSVVSAQATHDAVYPADVDWDGDVDVLSASSQWNSANETFDANISWYENIDGQGTFGERQAISYQRATSLLAADLDGDGDADVLTAVDDQITWHENRLAGDADDNGKVEFADFLALSDNFGGADAVWEDGDFNSDRIVNFADFLILSDNYGKSRPAEVPLTMSSITRYREAPSRSHIGATDDLFKRLDAKLNAEEPNQMLV